MGKSTPAKPATSKPAAGKHSKAAAKAGVALTDDQLDQASGGAFDAYLTLPPPPKHK
jgi:hypothetical protein